MQPRRKPLRRSGGLKRTSGLRPGGNLKRSVEAAREFLHRSRQPLRRTPLRSRPKARTPEGPLTPAQWRQAVFEASGGACIISGARARDADDRRFHAHHILPKRELRARGLFGWVWDARNGAWLRADIHELHESPGVSSSRVPAAKLPGAVWGFCRELDELEGSEWATQLVLRVHR